MIVKIIGAVILSLSGLAFGMYLASSLVKRKEFLCAFLEFITRLETHLRYDCDDIFSLVTRCCDNKYLTFYSFAENNIIKPFGDVWEEKTNRLPKAFSLSKEDKTVLLDFGKGLGTTDVSGQLKHLKLYKEKINFQLIDAQSKIDKKSRLYKTLGFFAGASVAIMIV